MSFIDEPIATQHQEELCEIEQHVYVCGIGRGCWIRIRMCFWRTPTLTLDHVILTYKFRIWFLIFSFIDL